MLTEQLCFRHSSKTSTIAAGYIWRWDISASSWSMTVTRNWRMTFGVNVEGALIDLDLEDYHGA